MPLMDVLSGKVTALNSIKEKGQNCFNIITSGLNQDSFLYSHYKALSITYCEVCRILFESSPVFKSTIKSVKFLPLLKYTTTLITAHIINEYRKSPEIFSHLYINENALFQIKIDCNYGIKDKEILSSLIKIYDEKDEDKKIDFRVNFAKEYFLESTHRECGMNDLYFLLTNTDYLITVYSEMLSCNLSKNMYI